MNCFYKLYLNYLQESLIWEESRGQQNFLGLIFNLLASTSFFLKLLYPMLQLFLSFDREGLPKSKQLSSAKGQGLDITASPTSFT